MANFTRNGYGQVEANQISGIKAGKVFASLKLDPDVTVLQNGEFMYYNYSKDMVTADGKIKDSQEEMAEPYLVYNEVKLYEDRLGYKDFAMIRVGDNYVTNDPHYVYGGGALNTGASAVDAPVWPVQTQPPVNFSAGDVWNGGGYRMDGIAPRMIKTTVGDVFTTNMVKTGVDYQVGNILVPKKNATTNTLQLEIGTGAMEFAVVKVYTMPDGQPGLKLQRIK